MLKLKYLLTIFFGIGVVVAGLLFLNSKKNQFENENFVILPSKVQAIDEESTNDMVSPDGKEILTIKAKKQNKETIYSFYVGGKLLFIKATIGKIVLPFNTWSTNDKYFLIKEVLSDKTNFYFEPDEINVTDKFFEKFPDYKLQEVTGWAGPNLLVVNASDGKNDISFWFDTANESFIRLSNRFN